MKIDIFNHIMPQAYFDKMLEVAPDHKDLGMRVKNIPFLVDLDLRFRILDEFDDYCQVLSLAAPPPEVLAGPNASPGLVTVGNDSMAELCQKYPDRFPAFTAYLPMNNADAAMTELHRVIKDLGAKGIQIFSNVNGRPLDEPEFAPIFDAMAEYDLPIWLHPARGADFADYKTETKSKYEIWWAFGWAYETSAAMARLVFAGIFDKHPKIKIITHHMGAMAPFFEGRVGPGLDQLGARTSDEDYGALLKSLKKRPIDYFKMFYADTALFGSASATRCGLDFFGVDHALFASDSPFDPEKGPGYIRDTIAVIDGLDITDEERHRIYTGNAERLLGISVG